VRSEIPGAAASNTVIAFIARPGRSVRRRVIITAVIAVLHPLINVSWHIMHTERIGWEGPNGRRTTTVPLTPAAVAVGLGEH
jgi:hypothetical protein